MSPSTLQIIAVTIFALAIIHIFSVKYFEHLAHRSEKHSGLFHLLGEIEVVFGIWAMILVLFMSHLQIAINNPQFKLNQIQKKPFEIV